MRMSLTRVVAVAAIASAAVLPLASTASAATTVAKAPTTLSIVESKARIVPGHLDVISGVLMTGKNGLAKRTIDLYRYDARAMMWVPVAASRACKGGKVAFVVTPMATVRYELVFYGSPSLDPSRSGAASVTVTS